MSLCAISAECRSEVAWWVRVHVVNGEVDVLRKSAVALARFLVGVLHRLVGQGRAFYELKICSVLQHFRHNHNNSNCSYHSRTLEQIKSHTYIQAYELFQYGQGQCISTDHCCLHTIVGVCAVI